MGLLELLAKLFGKSYLNKIMGTRTNVAKPIRMDNNSPFRKYSDSAFDDPKVLQYIEKKLNEYGPYALSNKNPQELANFEDNAKRLLAAKNKQTGTTPGMQKAMEPKPEAEIVDIRTQQKVKPEGIETLKSEIGLPEGIEPGSIADKAIKESAEYKMNQQGVKSLLDEDYKPPKTTTIDEDEAFEFEKLDKDPRRPGGPLDPAVGITRAGARLVLENKGIKIGSKDPLDLVRENFGQDFLNDINNLSEEMLEIDRRGGSYRDLTDLLKREGLYDAPINKDAPKGYTAEEMKKIMDEADEKDLGDKLKDLPDDIDPDALAEGGRPGFKFGTGKGIMKLKDLINKKFGKGTMKTADEVKPSEFKAFKTERDFDDLAEKLNLEKDFKAFNKRNRKLTDEEYEDLVAEYGEGVPQLETVADAERFVQGQKDYQAAMFRDYKAGRLDPKPGEPGRKRYLEKKAEEAEMSGDSRLFTPDEADELTSMQKFGGPKTDDYYRQSLQIEVNKLPIEELTPEALKVKFPGMPDEMAQMVGNDTNLQRKAEAIAAIEQAFGLKDAGKSADEIIEILKREPETKMADGGPVTEDVSLTVIKIPDISQSGVESLFKRR